VGKRTLCMRHFLKSRLYETVQKYFGENLNDSWDLDKNTQKIKFFFRYVKFLQSHPPITETFRFCLIVYLHNMFQPSTGSSSGTNELNYQNDFF
jgi:hypothetical protein